MSNEIDLSNQVLQREITLCNLIEQLMEFDSDVIIEFIKHLDAECQDWGVTNELYEHFASLHEVYLIELEADLE